jgi:uncharacterized membrane protein
MNITNIVRWVHIISGVAWLGEVITINFVLFPALIKISRESRGKFIRQIFPRIFQLASILSLTAIVSGTAMSYLITGWRDLSELLNTRWGLGIIIGGSLAFLLTLFHFFVESRLEPLATTADEGSEIDIEKIIAVLRIVPRIGMIILVLIVLLMMYAARGL